jgi:hypothetical protein
MRSKRTQAKRARRMRFWVKSTVFKSNGRLTPATIGEKKMQKPTILEIACAVFGFAALALFVFMLLAY